MVIFHLLCKHVKNFTNLLNCHFVYTDNVLKLSFVAEVRSIDVCASQTGTRSERLRRPKSRKEGTRTATFLLTWKCLPD